MLKDRGGSGLTSPNSPTNPSGGGSSLAEGVSFDGSTDYLSRASDLTGNVDSKAFTFSCFFYNTPSTTGDVYLFSSGDVGTNNGYFNIVLQNTGEVKIIGYNNIGTRILYTITPSSVFKKNTWSHILISLDMVSSANCKVYVNDINITPLTFNNYTNENLIFTKANKGVSYDTKAPAVSPLVGRLSNFFLDYTYRDLSIEANRRIFSVPM
mgnify:CR=1 FL=1